MSREAEFSWSSMYSATADRVEFLYNAGMVNLAARMERDAEIELERLADEAEKPLTRKPHHSHHGG